MTRRADSKPSDRNMMIRPSTLRFSSCGNGEQGVMHLPYGMHSMTTTVASDLNAPRDDRAPRVALSIKALRDLHLMMCEATVTVQTRKGRLHMTPN